jgi:predicted ATPase with chaperone activity
MVVEHLAEIARRGSTDIDIEYQLTAAGKIRASELTARSGYVGPAPVTLSAYQAMVAQQSVKCNRVTKHDVEAAFVDLTLNAEVRNQIGAAMNSGRPLFLYGPAGSGKTYLSEKLNRLLPGLIAVPHAIVVDNEIIQVYDALLHEQVGAVPHTQDYRQTDNRWVICKRPVVITGGELTIDMLDLIYDRSAGFYQSPPHFKANNGIFIVDDLGRQKVSTQDLMNRWVVPMEHSHDYLTLHTGYKFTIPFDVSLVFSTNLSPSDVADESFLRRLGYKIHIGPLSEDEYRQVFQQHAKSLGVIYDETAFRYLIDNLHQECGQPLIACYPYDILNQIVDYARYNGETPMVTQLALDRAWLTYFARDYAL